MTLENQKQGGQAGVCCYTWGVQCLSLDEGVRPCFTFLMFVVTLQITMWAMRIGFHSCPPMQRPSLCLTKSLPTSSERIPLYPTMPVLFALLPTMFTLCLLFQPSLKTGSPASWCDSFSSSWAGQTPHASEPHPDTELLIFLVFLWGWWLFL